MKKTQLLTVGVLLSAVGGLLVWQHHDVRQLQAENHEWRRATSELQAAREENARLSQGSIDPAELERLRAGQSELIRLRGQVAQLRRQAADAASKRPAPVPETPPDVASELTSQPVETYSATVEAVIPWSQTLVYGGWTLPSGKRAMVLIRADEGDQFGQITLQSHIVELPEWVLPRMGWDGINAGNKQGGGYTMVSFMSTDDIKKLGGQYDGVDVLSAPKVITTDGRLAQVKVADTRTAPNGKQYEVGSSLDLLPKISADRTSVELTISAQLKIPSTPAE